MNLLLTRDRDDGRCTLGLLTNNGSVWQSLERPWIPGISHGGTKGISCIPLGIYRLVRHDTEAHPRSFALVNESLGVYHYQVPQGREGRTACLIHVANRVEELRGCVALGMERVQTSPTTWEVRRSRVAIEKFHALLPWVDGQHTLEIMSG